MELSPKRQSIIGAAARTGSWSNAPDDIISSVANSLGFIDSIAFRSVCKDWQSASPISSPEIHSPWLLLRDEASTNCILYNVPDKIKYNIDLPELQGTVCLASNQGWLLLSRANSIFFYCPFSRSKIKLPEFPHADLVNQVAAFSALPTSPDCAVAIMKRYDEEKFEINVVQRGENTWTTVSHSFSEGKLGVITCGLYCEKSFNFVDKEEEVLVEFWAEDKSITTWNIVRITDPTLETVPFMSKKNYLSNSNIKSLLELGQNVGVSTCGTMIGVEKSHVVVHNEDVEAVVVEGGGGAEARNLMGIWIHPRYHYTVQGW